MTFNISKTDQVLVLLNRLAVSENPSKLGSNERECLLDPEDHEDGDKCQDSSLNLDVEGQAPRRWSGTAKGPSTRRKSQDCEPAAALRIVLGDRRSSVTSERKLRYHFVMSAFPSRPSPQGFSSGFCWLTLEHKYRYTDSFRTKLFGQAKRGPGRLVCVPSALYPCQT